MVRPNMKALVSTAIVLFGCIFSAQSSMIDNHLVGEPVVDCQDTSISLTFTTEKPFNGRVFVKGLADDDRCSRNFATNTEQKKFSLVIDNGECSMQRHRVSVEKREGVMFSLVIVVSFHGVFITKVDRAYRSMCFFRNIKHVTNILDVSMIGTTELLEQGKMPTCTYSIHSDSEDGPPVRYAKVGAKIYHVWECDDDQQGFLVHSCAVNDGRGNRFDLMDIDGCSIDPIIQPDIKYSDSKARASVETWSYKFSDTSVLNYECVIELCKKAQGECTGLTPPNCRHPARRRRSVSGSDRVTPANDSSLLERRLNDNQMDIVADMHVLDTLDQELGLAEPTKKLLDQLNSQPSQRALFMSSADTNYCLSTTSISIIMAISLILVIVILITVSLHCYKLKYNDKM